MNRYDANLESILWSALAGWGLGASREEMAALPLAYPNGRQTSWPAVIKMFCEMSRGRGASEPYLVGEFLSFCVSNGELLAAQKAGPGLSKGRSGPGRGKAGSPAAPAFAGSAPTLAEVGISRKLSSQAQAVASLPADARRRMRAVTPPDSTNTK